MRSFLQWWILLSIAPQNVWATADAWIDITEGMYRPFFAPSEEQSKRLLDLNKEENVKDFNLNQLVKIERFLLHRRPVTNQAFLRFVMKHPEWKRSLVPEIFSDKMYLNHWPGDMDAGKKSALASPVVYVSWFAARAFCKAEGGRLPTTDEWEYVSSLDEGERRDQVIFKWYEKPTGSKPNLQSSAYVSKLGVHDMHGKIWEWTNDFNSASMMSGSRGEALAGGMFCGAGANGAVNPSDYATFMRTAFRSSLKGNYAIPTLGFRCAKDA